ncbi:MAG TPA: hypothetical protein VG267_04120 [Terracidiphilus sp.]|jgi:hypothetical protein|nr:hypothetical protein [Terracidiphilus sp.]
MIPHDQNEMKDRVSAAEKTLRLVSGLPAPEGLADRVQEGLRKAPRDRLVEWPRSLMHGGWMTSPALRGAAAAAIVCVVVGGGWRIYSRVQAPAPTANVITMPARVGSQGAFSNAGAMRTPDTLAGPVLTHAVTPDKTKAPARRAKRRNARRPATAAAQSVQPR